MRDIKYIKATIETNKNSTKWIYVVYFVDGSQQFIGTSNAYSPKPEYRPAYKFASVNSSKKYGFSKSHDLGDFPIVSCYNPF